MGNKNTSIRTTPGERSFFSRKNVALEAQLVSNLCVVLLHFVKGNQKPFPGLYAYSGIQGVS